MAKGELLQRQGDVSSYAYYIIKGILRSYIIDSKGKEHIFHFAFEDWVIADIESQEFDQPADLFIDGIEDSEVVIFSRECLLKADRSVSMIADEVKMLSRNIGVLQRRVLMLMSTSASDRYEYFIKTYPHLLNRVPMHMIASYLGITPQALSTIRTKLVRSLE